MDNGHFKNFNEFGCVFFFHSCSEKRPDKANNRRPTLGCIQNHRPNTRYRQSRQGYHYQPVASTSQFSPTFVFGNDKDYFSKNEMPH